MSQSICQTADFSFEHPSDWIDRTVIVRSAPPNGSAVPPNVVIAYDKIPLGSDLDGYVQRQIADLSRAMQGFQLELRRPIGFSGRHAVELLFIWVAAIGTMRQRQVYAALDDRRVVSVACTALGTDFAPNEPLFDQLLSSFRWV